MDDATGPTVGQRLREIRAWRGLSLRAAAELAGFSAAYLSRIERGERPVDRRSTLEALAAALRVAPTELTGTPYLTNAPQNGHAALVSLRTALAVAELGEPVDLDPPAWPLLRERLAALNALRQRADYVALGEALPNLILDLHASLPGRDALIGLAECYLAAQVTARNLGALDLAHVAARHVHDATAQLSDPEWSGLGAWARAHAISTTARSRAYTVTNRAAVEIQGHLDKPEVAEMYGFLHLTAALAATTLGRMEDAATHVAEAADVAARPGVGALDGFAHLSFGAGNVEIWRTMLAVEAGEGGRAVEIARAVDPSTLPESVDRRSAWWADIGRGLAMERATRDESVRAFRKAEDLSPQRVRADPFVREVVTDLLRQARRDAVGRELRGLAYRMGLSA